MNIPVDLLIAIGAVAGISFLMACVGVKSRRGYSTALAAVAAAMLLVQALWLKDSPLLARVLPVANVIAWSNLQTPAMALLAGVAWSRLTGPAAQKYILLGALVGLGSWRLVEPYVGSPPVVGASHWSHGICVQSTRSTCSDAAAATLLNRDGIAATEAEMVRLCLTHVDGTTMLGLYRGLKIKTEGTRWMVKVVTGPAAALKTQPLPAIVNISDPGVPSGLMGIGNRHSVVVLAFIDDMHIIIGDPFTGGRQRWTLTELSRAYQSDGGFALARR